MSRNARICSGSRVRSLSLPSVTSRLPHKRLEVGAVTDAVGRIDVDRLYLAAQTLLFQQAVHDQQTVTGDQAVRPVVPVTIEVDRLPDRAVLLRLGEQRRLHTGTVLLAGRFDDRLWIDPFVNMKRDRRGPQTRCAPPSPPKRSPGPSADRGRTASCPNRGRWRGVTNPTGGLLARSLSVCA